MKYYLVHDRLTNSTLNETWLLRGSGTYWEWYNRYNNQWDELDIEGLGCNHPSRWKSTVKITKEEMDMFEMNLGKMIPAGKFIEEDE